MSEASRPHAAETPAATDAAARPVAETRPNTGPDTSPDASPGASPGAKPAADADAETTAETTAGATDQASPSADASAQAEVDADADADAVKTDTSAAATRPADANTPAQTEPDAAAPDGPAALAVPAGVVQTAAPGEPQAPTEPTAPPEPVKQVLLIEPDTPMRGSMAQAFLEQPGLKLHTAASLVSGEALMKEFEIAALLLSVADADNALNFLARLRAGELRCAPDLPVMALAHDCDAGLLEQVKALSVRRLLLRPFKLREVALTLAQLWTPDTRPPPENVPQPRVDAPEPEPEPEPESDADAEGHAGDRADTADSEAAA